MEFGAILKACRTRAKMTQEDLAYKLCISQSDVSKYENDTKEPPMSIFKEWALHTQTSEVVVAFLLGMDGITMMQQISSLIVGFIHF